MCARECRHTHVYTCLICLFMTVFLLFLFVALAVLELSLFKRLALKSEIPVLLLP